MRCHDHQFGRPQTEYPQSKVIGCNICNETTAVHSGLPIPTATTKREQPLPRDGREIRYKGFLQLAANCDHATATGRVERIRQAVEHLKE